MSNFTTMLQAHVAWEFKVDQRVGIELIRSASSLFPEVAKIAHYVRHNRCFQGSLKPGDVAPDVPLFSLDGNKSTLWTEIDGRQGKTAIVGNNNNGAADDGRPVVVLGASYT